MADISDRSTNESTDAIESEAKDDPEVPAEVVPQVPPWKKRESIQSTIETDMDHNWSGTKENQCSISLSTLYKLISFF